jgi:hypothetical protein
MSYIINMNIEENIILRDGWKGLGEFCLYTSSPCK